MAKQILNDANQFLGNQGSLETADLEMGEFGHIAKLRDRHQHVVSTREQLARAIDTVSEKLPRIILEELVKSPYPYTRVTEQGGKISLSSISPETLEAIGLSVKSEGNKTQSVQASEVAAKLVPLVVAGGAERKKRITAYMDGLESLEDITADKQALSQAEKIVRRRTNPGDSQIEKQ